MKTSMFLSEERLIAEGVDVLVEKLGIVESVRFLTLPVRKRRESVSRHRMWQSKLDKDAFFDRVISLNPDSQDDRDKPTS